MTDDVAVPRPGDTLPTAPVGPEVVIETEPVSPEPTDVPDGDIGASEPPATPEDSGDGTTDQGVEP